MALWASLGCDERSSEKVSKSSRTMARWRRVQLLSFVVDEGIVTEEGAVESEENVQGLTGFLRNRDTFVCTKSLLYKQSVAV